MCSFDFHILSRTSTAFRWTRGGTAIGSQEAGFVVGGTGNDAWRARANNHYLDHPNSTSSQTYRLQFLPYDSGRTVYWHLLVLIILVLMIIIVEQRFNSLNLQD